MESLVGTISRRLSPRYLEGAALLLFLLSFVPVVLSIDWSFFRSGLFLILSLVCLAFSFFPPERRSELASFAKRNAKFIVLAGITLILGPLIGWLSFLEDHRAEAFAQFIRLASNFLAFAAVLWLALRSRLYSRLILGAFCLPLLLFPLVYMACHTFSFVNQDMFFLGLTDNSSFFALSTVPAVVILSALLCSPGLSRRSRLGVFLLFVAASALLIVSVSRAAWFGAVLGSALAVFFPARSEGGPAGPSLFTRVSLIFFGFCLAFAILPTVFKISALGRLNDVASSRLYAYRDMAARDASYIKGLKLHLDLRDFWIDPRYIFQSSGRDVLWNASLVAFAKHPFGYGPAFAGIVNLNNGSTGHKNPHNIFLETALLGGTISLVSFCALLGLVFKRAMREFRKNAVSLGLFAAVLGSLITLLGGDGLLLRWFWVLLALFLAEIWASTSQRSRASE